ncbi:hypothetical protein ACU686_28135 [Yinghuangia aomiensis]
MPGQKIHQGTRQSRPPRLLGGDGDAEERWRFWPSLPERGSSLVTGAAQRVPRSRAMTRPGVEMARAGRVSQHVPMSGVEQHSSAW